MRKYLASFRLILMQAVDYRVESLLWILIDIFPITIAIITWKSIFQDKISLSGITFAQLVLYYLATILVDKLTATHFEERWIEKVQKGMIDIYFFKPIKLPTFLFSEMLANKLVGIFMFLFPFALFTFLFASGFIQTISFTPISILFFFGFIFLSLVINYLLSFAILLCAIWFEEAEALSHAKWLCISIFGGLMAPLEFYPQWMQNVANVLPFKRMISLPANMFTHTYSSQYLLCELGILFVYVLLFALLLSFLWEKAVKAYTSFGG